MEPQVLNYFVPLRTELEKYLTPEQIAEIYQAYLVAEKAHAPQKRQTGEPYITHPVAAAVMLAEMRMDYKSIMATLLHDVIEDTPVTKPELIELFGEEVAELVDGVSKLTQIKFETRAEAQAENFRKMVLAMVRDIRVILVKLVDRLHNMRTLGTLPAEKRRRVALETLEIYAPIANRLGIHKFYVELEDLGFEALYPMRARVLKEVVQKARGHRQEIMRKIEHDIKQALRQIDISVLSLFGRQKHLYSIYQKMQTKSAAFSEIMDVYGFRIMTDSVDSCYRVLGMVHQVYKPVPERFKDYIAIPKANGYQSLHTTLFGPYGVPIEVQIRTEEMDHIAENGIAAHWLYKADGVVADDAQLRARAWIKGLLEMQHNAGSSLEFIENVKFDLFPDEVYVFTPQGDIMELPRGATPVDFAYTVHSDIGSSCVAAKVNRRLAPLSVPLMNGQTVEIITAPGASPNPAWLNFVVSGKARSNIKDYLKSQQLAEAIVLGKRLLEKALFELNTSLEVISQEKEELLQQVLHELHYKGTEQLYYALGMGTQMAAAIAKRLVPTALEDAFTEAAAQRIGKSMSLAIKGTEGTILTYAECCRPIPGDLIIGCLQTGRGITVHVEDCPVLDRFRTKPEKLISMRWEDEVAGEFKVDITVEVINQRGILAKLTNAISDAEANIDNIGVDSAEERCNVVKFTLSVRDRVHLARVMRRIRMYKMVVKLYRSRNVS